MNKHPAQSFAQLVSKQQIEILKPFARAVIVEEVAKEMPDIDRNLKLRLDKAMGAAAVRIKMLEDILCEKLGETEQSLDERLLITEDKMLDLTVSTDPIAEGDYVRATVTTPSVPGSDEKAWSFARVNTKPYEVDEKIEFELIGMKTGETKTVIAHHMGKDLELQIKITRISKYAKKEEAAPVATPEQATA